MRRCTRLATLVLLTSLIGSLSAADWPQWRGPNRDGQSGEVGVKNALIAAGGPKLAWTFKDAGWGNSTPAVVGDRAYVLGARTVDKKDTDFVIALDVKNGGKELWATPIGPTYEFQQSFSKGPASCPSVEKDRLYALSSAGVLICVDTTSGKEVWKNDLKKTMGAIVTEKGGGKEGMDGWGFSWSPLIDEDKLIITPGGQKGLIAALDKKTGETIWQSKLIVEDCTYASVIAADILGVRQYIAMTQKGVVAVDPKTGNTIWDYLREQPYKDMVCTTPIVQGDRILLAAIGGTEVLEIAKAGAGFMATPVFPNIIKTLNNHHGGTVLVKGYVYGGNDGRGWVCLDFTKGRTTWSSREDLGYGPICYVDGVLVLQSQDNDNVVIADADPKKFTKLGGWNMPETSKLRGTGTPLASAKFWSPPVVAAGKLFLRDQNLLFCYELK
jgi:outer membrane protein assembly factor BamB